MIPFQSNPSFSFTETCLLPYHTYEQDVVSVLESIKDLFSRYFTGVDNNPLKIYNIYPSDEYPMTIYEKFAIILSVSPLADDRTPGCYWSQFIYQFSHEFCHYMNFGHVTSNMRWFEETLCELASHFFLLQASRQWSISPPYNEWRSYAKKLSQYELLARTDVKQIDYHDGFPRILKSLEDDEYQRAYNRFIALSLLPLFIDNPELWKIVPCLTSLQPNLDFYHNLHLLEELSGVNLSQIISIFFDHKNNFS